MEWGQQMRKHEQVSRDAMYQNSNYSFERREKKTLILEVDMPSAANTTFSVNLLEPLIIDKLSDIYLDNFTTFNAVVNTSIENMSIILGIEQFNIVSNIASNIARNTDSDETTRDSQKFNKIVIPNEYVSGGTQTHKGKKMNYICSINPTKLFQINGTITDAGQTGTVPTYGEAIQADGRFIAEFVIVARDN